MIRKEIDLHLEALAGYINDEDKVVTYKWLSKELGIHVNLAKQILYEFWENHSKAKKGSLYATFLLMGYLEDGGMQVEVVKDADLAAAKKHFSKIISEHIYSLQNSLPELELLAIEERGDSQHSAVRFSESVIRSDHEMDVLRWGTNLANNKPVKNVQNIASKAQKPGNTETKPVDRTNNVTGKESTAKTTAISKPAGKTQKNAFNNMFAKAIDKQNKEKALGSSDNKKTKEQEKVEAKISPPKNAWFGAARKTKDVKEDSVQPEIDKQSSKDLVNSNNIRSKADALSDDSDSPPAKKNSWFETKKKPMSGKQQPETGNGSIEFKSGDNKKHEESSDSEGKIDEKELSKKSISSGKTVGKKKAASSSRGKKRQGSSKNENINKKRKRIVVVESSDEQSGSEMEDLREPDSPERPQVIEKIRNTPSPPLVKCEGGRRKVRKLVDKTFMDEDGYFVTQKEYVYESCSDKEDEGVKVDANIPSTSEPVVKIVPNKRKQATLPNFFKKS